MPTIHDLREQLAELKLALEQPDGAALLASFAEGTLKVPETGLIRIHGDEGGTMAEAETMRGAVELSAQSVDSTGQSWIEVMPVAEKARNGPHYFTLTADDLQAAVDYIKANPDRIPIDYDHAEAGSTKAAGWFTGNAEIRDGSVWAEVKWTPAAVQEIQDGSFRYISPEWSMQHKDSKTGLWTKFKELAAATLTNRPFFKEMAAVTAKEQVDAVAAEHGDDIAELVLANIQAEAAQRLLAAVWTSSYIDNLPDSSFLYIEDGGTKDSDGKTQPRALRHFPVKDSSGNVDLAHVRNALARIPQSNVPADAKTSATAAAQRMLRDAGGNPSATDQGNRTTNEGDPVSENENGTEQVTDYMRMLGLDDTVDPKHRLAAAFREKDEKIEALQQKVTELAVAGDSKSREAEGLAARVEELEQKDRTRDIDVLLARAVESGRVFPAEKDTLAELFAADVAGLKRLIATRQPEMFKATAKGVAGDPDRFADDPDVATLAKSYGTDDPVDTEQAKQHLAAMKILGEQGKADKYTDDEYITAYTQAAQLVY